MPTGHLYVFFGEMSVKAYCPFFNWVVWVFCCCWVVWGVCIFWRLSSHWLHYLQIFSTGLFILFMVSFSVWKLIGLIGFHLFIFVFISIALGDWPKKTLVRFMSQNVLPFVSSWSFMESCLICKSLSNFAFTFLYDVRKCSILIDSHVAFQLSQYHLLKRLSFLH